MESNDEQALAQWQADLARLAVQMRDVRARIEHECRTMHAHFSAEIAALQAELRALQATVDAAGPGAYAKRIEAQIEDLRAKGDAAYGMLLAEMAEQPNAAEAEIRRLESAAAATSGAARERIQARIDAMKSAHARTPSDSDDRAARP